MAFTACARSRTITSSTPCAAQMPNFSPSLYSSAPVRTLFQRELAATGPVLSGVYGNHGLLVHAHPDAPRELPPHLLGTIVTLTLDQQMFTGSLRCEPGLLPFASESFKLVI